MELTQLKTFLDNNIIPTIPEKPKTFLGIAKQPHYENVLSNIYAFYFEVNEEHGMKDLFLKSFQELIHETEIGKTKEIEFNDDFVIETEFTTKKNGRIDIVLYNDDEAIIIENKVYHHLNNDLKDYWDSVIPERPVQNKIGVILSLKKYSQAEIYHSQFINITQHEFLTRVMKNSGEYLSKAKDRYIVFLKDLYQNTVNLSNSMEKEKIDFYYKHQVELNDAAKLKFAVRDFIKSEVEHAGNGLDHVKLVAPRAKSFNSNRLRYYESTINPELVYTIVFEDLLNDKKKLYIIVEPRGETLKNGATFKNVEFNADEKLRLQPTFYDKTNEGWAHFASRPYDLESKDIADLSTFIQKKIKEDHFESIMKKLEDHLQSDSKLKNE